jgi:hypothetical protein
VSESVRTDILSYTCPGGKIFYNGKYHRPCQS